MGTIVGAFGFKWLRKNKNLGPSLSQIIDGLKSHLLGRIAEEGRQMPRGRLALIDQALIKVFKIIMRIVDYECPNWPLLARCNEQDGLWYPVKNGLPDPDNKAT